MDLYEVLRRPVVTEKNTLLSEQGKYTFEVAKNANKWQVKLAVEKAFKVNVTDVNIIWVPGKSRRVGRRRIQSSPWKKAVVSLKTGQKIELFEGV
ncbi:MAG: 50S ribosomal protein L23 [Chloroflexota bacterium]|nr:50S ribosomal protein L23 [Chloroflexota bacterium]